MFGRAVHFKLLYRYLARRFSSINFGSTMLLTAHCSSCISPTDSLGLWLQTAIPADVLVKIFEHAVQLHFEWEDESFTLQPGMLNMAHVCTLWRRVALSNPLLWSRITMFNATRASIRRTEMHLERARDVPLVIALQIRSKAVLDLGMDSWERHLTYHALNSLIARQNRWQYFGLATSVHAFLPGQKFVLHDLPLLRNMVLGFPLRTGSETGIFDVDISRSPLLQNLHLWGDITLRVSPTRSLLHLTSIELNHTDPEQLFPSVQDCLLVMSVAPNLKYARIFPSFSARHDESNLPFIQCNKLRSLHVGSHGQRCVIVPILSHLTAPALRKLTITNNVVRRRWNDEVVEALCTDYGLCSFLKRSIPPLESFAVRSWIEDEAQIISALKCMPNLTHLDISLCETLTPTIMRSLVLFPGPNSTDNLCPKLKTIRFCKCIFLGPSLELTEAESVVLNSVKMMLVSRWDGAGLREGLHKVELKSCKLSPLLEDEQIQRCIWEGLSLICKDEDRQEGLVREREI